MIVFRVITICVKGMFMKYAILLLIPLNCIADIRDQLRKCLTLVEIESKRLKCYDNIIKPINKKNKIQTKTKTKKIVDYGLWKNYSTTSKIDDSKNVSLYLNANMNVKGFMTGNILPQLIIQCSERKTSVYINWNRFITSGGIYSGTKVLTRLDKKKARNTTWNVSTDYKATFKRGKNISFIKKLMRHKNLYVQTIPYGESSISTDFNLRGLKDAILPLRKACRW